MEKAECLVFSAVAVFIYTAAALLFRRRPISGRLSTGLIVLKSKNGLIRVSAGGLCFQRASHARPDMEERVFLDRWKREESVEKKTKWNSFFLSFIPQGENQYFSLPFDQVWVRPFLTQLVSSFFSADKSTDAEREKGPGRHMEQRWKTMHRRRERKKIGMQM